MKLIALSGSNSSQSINRQLAAWVAGQFRGFEVEVLGMDDFDLPLFGVDLEKKIGSPPAVKQFLDAINSADFIVLSLPENNRIYSAAFKNLFDWVSRVDAKVFRNKPMLLMSTSTGKRGGSSVLAFADQHLPNYGADIRGTFSLPEFNLNFRPGEGIVNKELKEKILGIVHALQSEF
jgi:chromate reductase, NAD(P)H dehydrogenase (quinone)